MLADIAAAKAQCKKFRQFPCAETAKTQCADELHTITFEQSDAIPTIQDLEVLTPDRVSFRVMTEGALLDVLAPHLGSSAKRLPDELADLVAGECLDALFVKLDDGNRLMVTALRPAGRFLVLTFDVAPGHDAL